MSAEHFQTILVADMRIGQDGKPEIATAYSQQPRAIENGQFTVYRQGGWVCCYLYAEHVIQIAAQSIREQPMAGTSGDHPERRMEIADELDHLAKRVRLLALDAACDSHLTDEQWDHYKENNNDE